MSLDTFLDNPYGEDDNSSDGRNVFVNIAKCKIELAFEGWANGEPQHFTFIPDTTGDNERLAKQQCQEYIDSGTNMFDQPPRHGLLFTMYGDDVPSHKDGALEYDNITFVPSFHSIERFYVSQKALVSYSQDQIDQYEALKTGDGTFPYDALIMCLREHRSSFNNVVWCKVHEVIDPVFVMKEKAKKNGHPIRYSLIVETYNNRDEAVKAAGVQNSDNSQNDNTVTASNAGLSEYAKSQRWTVELLKDMIPGIRKQIQNLVAEGKTQTEATVTICEANSIQPSDLNLFAEKPF